MKFATIASIATISASPIQIEVNGASKNMFMVGSGSASGPTGYTLHHNSGVKLMTQSQMSPTGFYQPDLLGGSIEYDIGLNDVDCSCNAAFYMVSSPGKYESGVPNPGPAGDYYCDANNVGGQWCPEMDLMEANKYAFRMTPHKCDAPSNKDHYYNCDRSGCGKSIHEVDSNAYGPGGQYRINTNNWFHVKIDFKKEGDRLTAIILTLGQGSNTFSLQVADADCAWGYLDAMRGPISSGMTLVSSNWGGPGIDMSWLDGETGCQGNCGGSPTFSVTHIKYNTPREKNFFATEHQNLSVQPPQNKIYTGNFEHQTHQKIFSDFEMMKNSSMMTTTESAPENLAQEATVTNYQIHEAPQNKIYTGNFEHQTHKKIFDDFEFMQH